MTDLHCDICGGRAERFENVEFPIEHRGLHAVAHGLSGIRCLAGEACGELFFDPESAAIYGKVGDELVLEARRRVGQELRRIRRKLGLTQAEAAEIAGGGHNAFSRYESGKVAPLPAVVHLFRLLDGDPALLTTVRTSL